MRYLIAHPCAEREEGEEDYERDEVAEGAHICEMREAAECGQ